LPTAAEPLEPKNLAVITSHFNPRGYQRPRESYYRFARSVHEAGVDLWVAELAFDDDPHVLSGSFSTSVMQLRGTREKNELWQKERLLNLMLDHLAKHECYDAVAWVDADVVFPDDGWPERVLTALRDYEAVQMYEDYYDLRPDGKMSMTGRSLVHGWKTSRVTTPVELQGAPGLAWAARFQPGGWLRRLGLYDSAACSANDVLQTWGFTGEQPWPSGWRDQQHPWLLQLREWADATYRETQGRIGFLPMSLVHLYHGSARDRGYGKIWAHVVNSYYDPATDVCVDENGLLAWTDYALEYKPALVLGVRNHFAARKEDS
jgi:hypothetical protein